MSEKIINISRKNDYYTQTNNRYIPLTSCTPTSAVMFLLAAGFRVVESSKARLVEYPAFVYPSNMQPEDYISTLANSLWGQDLRKTLTPWFKDDVPPQTIHVVVKEILNRVLGGQYITFQENMTMSQLEFEIRNKRPIMVSGKFTGDGHTVVVVGAKWTDHNELISLIIDDPYGNYKTNYSDKQGNDVEVPAQEFQELWHRFGYRLDTSKL